MPRPTIYDPATYIIGFVLVLVFALVQALSGCGGGADEAPPLAPGQAAAIGFPDRSAGQLYVATSEPSYDAMREAIAAGDQVGLNQLVASGGALVIERETPALVLDMGMTYKLRLTGGASAGEVVFVGNEFVQQP